jgi:putative methyltransferase (TIGR04325 family)
LAERNPNKMKLKNSQTMTQSEPIWEGVYNSFYEVPVEGPGFDGEIWIANSLKKIAVLRDEAEKNAPLPPTSNYREALLPLLAGLVYQENKGLRILDFGGGIGFTYFQTIYGLPSAENVEYDIFEVENVCQTGTDFFGADQDRPHFHSELPLAENGLFDIVHSGSALHYVEDWTKGIAQLCGLSQKYLLLVDVPAGNIPTFVTAQNYYGSKIPVRFFNVKELLSVIDSFGYTLIFKSVYNPIILGVEQDLPMQNFEEKYRLKRACNLLFKRSSNE